MTPTARPAGLRVGLRLARGHDPELVPLGRWQPGLLDAPDRGRLADVRQPGRRRAGELLGNIRGAVGGTLQLDPAERPSGDVRRLHLGFAGGGPRFSRYPDTRSHPDPPGID